MIVGSQEWRDTTRKNSLQTRAGWQERHIKETTENCPHFWPKVAENPRVGPIFAHIAVGKMLIARTAFSLAATCYC